MKSLGPDFAMRLPLPRWRPRPALRSACRDSALGLALGFALILHSAPHALAMPLAPAPLPAVHDIDWRTSPLDLNLRGFNGERFRFRCPPGKAAKGQVVGSGPYTDGSSICAAGVHAGAIRSATGGSVTIEVRPGEPRYVASLSHFVQSEAYEGLWSGSFLVIAPAAGPGPPGAESRQAYLSASSS
jgi:LCCL domain